jgi:uncharacterized membrane protein
MTQLEETSKIYSIKTKTKILKNLMIQINLANILDVLTTWIGVRKLDFIEINPMALAQWEMFGFWPSALIIKVGLVFLLTIFLYKWCSKRIELTNHRRFLVYPAFFFVLLLAVVINNSIELIQSMYWDWTG